MMRNYFGPLFLVTFLIAACDTAAPTDIIVNHRTDNLVGTGSTDQVCFPTEEDPCLGGGGGSSDPCPGCSGITIGGYSNRDECVASGQTDADADGIADYCEYNLAYAFRPEFYWDSGDADLGREPYYAVRTYPDGSFRIFYAIAYYKDGGDWKVLDSGHDGDSEFVIVDVSYDPTYGRWFTNTVFTSAHDGEVGDHSRFNTYSELAYTEGHYRGRPIIWVSEEKHANYNSQAACPSFELGCNGFMPGSLDIRQNTNLGNAQHKLVQFTLSWHYPNPNGTEDMWSTLRFCGWQASTCSTAGYGTILDRFGMS
jgi:hypothetical protein